VTRALSRDARAERDQAGAGFSSPSVITEHGDAGDRDDGQMSGFGRFLIRRVPAMRWIGTGPHPDPERIYDALREQAEWGFADPWMYRALASPATYEPMLRAPKRGDDPHYGPVAYWSSLLHLLVYGFGWVRLDRGLWWWYQNDKPAVDDHLRPISQVRDAQTGDPGRLRGCRAGEKGAYHREDGVCQHHARYHPIVHLNRYHCRRRCTARIVQDTLSQKDHSWLPNALGY
jgi:hypothetical protein